MNKPFLGFHVSISKSLDLAVDRACEIGCTCFQMFTRNPRGWDFKPLNDEEVSLFVEKRKKASYEKIVVHMPYLPNLAASDRPYQKRSRASLTEEVARCGRLKADYLVVHIGFHMGKGTMVGIRNVTEACNQALQTNQNDTMLLIETMAGQKNSVGSRFEELSMILDGIKQSNRAGVCVDTCHIFAAGFDISVPSGVEKTMGLFDEMVGLDRMNVVHLNDSLGGLGSGTDRHEHIGMGKIGERGLRAFLRYKKVAELPIVMETPIDERRTDQDNLKVARRLVGA